MGGQPGGGIQGVGRVDLKLKEELRADVHEACKGSISSVCIRDQDKVPEGHRCKAATVSDEEVFDKRESLLCIACNTGLDG
jgi:hypothetical protein